jgi:hypothetical protein
MGVYRLRPGVQKRKMFVPATTPVSQVAGTPSGMAIGSRVFFRADPQPASQLGEVLVSVGRLAIWVASNWLYKLLLLAEALRCFRVLRKARVREPGRGGKSGDGDRAGQEGSHYYQRRRHR